MIYGITHGRQVNEKYTRYIDRFKAIFCVWFKIYPMLIYRVKIPPVGVLIYYPRMELLYYTELFQMFCAYNTIMI